MSSQRRLVLYRLIAIGIGTLITLAAHPGWAKTLWTGPTIGFTQPANSGEADTVLAGSVVLTRGNDNVLYNTALGESYPPNFYSPSNTEWAFGTLDNLPASTNFQSFESLRDGNLATRILFQPMVMHIIKEDIYVSVTFTEWGTHHTGGFAYTRSTPAPTVSITNPVSGAAFTAPANVHIAASASYIGGTVTNVSFFNGTNLLDAVTTPPFNFVASNLAAGSYSLSAVAMASGLSGTSAVVNVSVVNPVAVSITGPQQTNGTFSFVYSANPGLTYVIQSSSNLVSWTPLATNTAPTNLSVYSEPFTATSRRYYRVGRLPNP